MFWFHILWTQNKGNFDIPYWKGRTDKVYYEKHVFFLFFIGFVFFKYSWWGSYYTQPFQSGFFSSFILLLR